MSTPKPSPSPKRKHRVHVFRVETPAEAARTNGPHGAWYGCVVCGKNAEIHMEGQ